MQKLRIAMKSKSPAGVPLGNPTLFPGRLLMFTLTSILIPMLAASGCQKKEVKHYLLQGEVISADPASGLLVIKHGDIPGFMPAMTMSYMVAVPDELRGLQPGDIVKADLVVSNDSAKLTRITLVEKAKPPQLPSTTPATPKKELRPVTNPRT